MLFDLDGTLVDSSRDITEALNYAIKPYGYVPLSVSETIKLVGEGITRLIEKVISDNLSIKEEVINRFLEHYSKNLTTHTRPYPKVEETLKALDSYTKAVISNKREALSRRLLEELKLAEYFEYIIGSDSTPEKKPSPVPIQHVLELTGLTPEDAMIIGDSNLDIKAGKAAGILTVAVLYGYRPPEVLTEADYFIKKDLSELLDLLRKIQE